MKTFSISTYPHHQNSTSALPSAIHDCIATGATKSKQLPRIPPIIPLIISLISQNTPKISPNVPSNTHEISKISLDRVAHLVGWSTMVACRSKNWTNKRRLRVEGDSGWSRWSRMMVGDPGCQAGRSPPVLQNTLVTRHHLHSSEKGEKFQN